MDVLALVSGLTACDPPTAARRDLEGCAEASARVRAWLDGFDVQIGRALEVKSGYGAKVLADAMKLSLAGGTRVIERGETLREVPAVEGAVHAGDVSGAHVDVITRALRQVPKVRRGEMASIIDERVHDARSLPANEYEDRLKVEVRRLQDGDDDSRKKKSIRFRSWVDKVFGMWRASMALDPATAVWVDKRITDEVDRLFADGVPDDAPDDPIERQQYLAALAVLSLLRGEGGSTGRPEVIVVVDATQADVVVDWGLPVDVPLGALGGRRCPRQAPRRRDLASHRSRSGPQPTARERGTTTGAARAVPDVCDSGLHRAVLSLQGAPRAGVGARRPHRPRQSAAPVQPPSPALRARQGLEAQAPA